MQDLSRVASRETAACFRLRGSTAVAALAMGCPEKVTDRVFGSGGPVVILAQGCVGTRRAIGVTKTFGAGERSEGSGNGD